MSGYLPNLDRARHHTDPFDWFHITDLFTGTAAGELAAAFPADGFTDVSATGEKSYAMAVLPLFRSPGPAASPPGLGEPWQRFVAETTSVSFADRVRAVTGRAVSADNVEVNLWRYGADCWLDPHVDKPDKAVTLICYLNTDWPQGKGGELLILGDRSEASVRHRVRPLLNTGVLLVRGDNSWHAVDRVHASAGGLVRRSAQVVFYTGHPC